MSWIKSNLTVYFFRYTSLITWKIRCKLLNVRVSISLQVINSPGNKLQHREVRIRSTMRTLRSSLSLSFSPAERSPRALVGWTVSFGWRGSRDGYRLPPQLVHRRFERYSPEELPTVASPASVRAGVQFKRRPGQYFAGIRKIAVLTNLPWIHSMIFTGQVGGIWTLIY